MQIINKFLILPLLTILLVFTSCKKDDDTSAPALTEGNTVTVRNTYEETVVSALSEGNTVTVRNTYQDDMVPEGSFAVLFGLSEDALDLTADLSNSEVEFEDVLALDLTSGGGPLVNPLYQIDLTETTIEFTLLPDAMDPFWSSNYRTLEAGVNDRYYLTFANAHNITGFTSSDPAINLRTDSDNVVVVEIREGFNFQPGANFTISLQGSGTPELSFPVFFGLPEDAFDATNTLSNTEVEFPEYTLVDLSAGGGPVLNPLYSIDLTETSIEFNLLPDDTDPFWVTNFRTLEAGVADRYYFTFGDTHSIESASSSDASVNLRVDSDSVIVVEIGEGFELQPGANFVITLN